MGSTRPPSPVGLTEWTLIVRAQAKTPESRQALEHLFRRYQGYIAGLIRRRSPPRDMSTEELVQEYLAYFLESDLLGKLDRARSRPGSFRRFLRISTTFFVCNQWDLYHRRPRGDVDVELFHAETPEDDVCDRLFLAELLSQALQLTREREPDKERFDKLARFLPGPQSDFVDYACLATELGLTQGHLRILVHRLRRHFEESVDELLFETLELQPPPSGGAPPASPRTAVRREKLELIRCLDIPQTQVRTLEF